MNEEIWIKKIEELNNEYLTDKNYQLGKGARNIINNLKRGKILNVIKIIILHIKKNKVKNEAEEPYREIIGTKANIIKTESKNKVAIYTCITGNYDKVEEPLIQETGCDYFLFTNNFNIQSKNWKIREIPKNILSIGDNAKINRYIKMHPWELFKDYDYSIYIDGNIKIISTLSDMADKVNEETGLAIHKHCGYDCIYDEVKSCIAYGKGNKKKLRKQIKRYKSDGFPKHYGMLECNILVSNLKNNNARIIFEQWWNEYLLSESKRDQIALPFVLWKNDILIEKIGELGHNVHKNYKIKINNHM